MIINVWSLTIDDDNSETGQYVTTQVFATEPEVDQALTRRYGKTTDDIDELQQQGVAVWWESHKLEINSRFPRFKIISETGGIVAFRDDQEEADQLAMITAVNTGHAVYVEDRAEDKINKVAKVEPS